MKSFFEQTKRIKNIHFGPLFGPQFGEVGKVDSSRYVKKCEKISKKPNKM